MQMEQNPEYPAYLSVGTEVSAKYKGAFCEAKIKKVVRNIKCKVAYKQAGLGNGNISDDQIKGLLRVGATVEVKHPDKRDQVEATILKIQDCSQYTVVFDDGDITTLRRSALHLKSGRHFNESETLDQLPLTHPEHFLNPPGRRGRRSRNLQDDSSDDDEEPIAKQTISDKEEHIGKVVCVETSDSKKKGPKENWFPGLVVAPTAQDTVRIRVKDEYLVRSFKDGRYYTVPKKEAAEFTRELGQKQDNPSVSAALEYLNKDSLPPHWDRDTLFGLIASSSDYEQDFLSDSSDDEPTEEKDRFVAQLYKFMDDRGTPLNKGPSIINRDVDLYRLFRAVQKLGGYNRVTSQNQWKSIALRLGFSPATASITSLVKQAYKKFLHSFEEFNRKLGCTMISHPRSNRTKGRSLVRASSVASPKLIEVREIHKASTSTSVASVVVTPVVIPSEDSESADQSPEPPKSKRRLSTSSNKVKAMVEKIEEKVKEKEKEKEKPVLKEDAPPPAPVSVSTPSTSKKEKVVKKIDPEKRGRKKKDSDVVEKKEKEPSTSETPSKPSIIPASASIANAPAPAIQAIGDFPIEVGDKLKVFYHENKVTYEAKVLEITYLANDEEYSYLVHYNGWNQRYDEWVKKDRVAENLTKDKLKKAKTGVKQEKGPPLSLNSLQTPSTKSKRGGRMRGDTTNSSRSTTPLSNASASRTKSPATSAHHRRITRGKTGNARRSSNNTDISSLRSDSDTDSDEPIKKPSISSQSSSNQKQDEKINKSSSSDFSSNEKGRGYDLSQIRAEMKGIKELKSDVPPHAAKSEDEKSIKSTKSSLKPGFDVKSNRKPDFEDPCSISSSDSCGATASDSDSSNVPSDVPNSSKSADTSEPEMEFKEKIERPTASKGSKWSEKRFESQEEVKPVVKKELISKGETSANSAKSSTFFEQIIAGQTPEKIESKTPSKFEPTKKTSIYTEKASTSRSLSAGEGKIGKFGPAEKIPAKETKTTPQKIKESKESKDVKDKSKISNDIYEFKDNEEFSEGAATTVASKKPPDLLLKESVPAATSTSTETEPKLSKKAQLIAQRKQAQAAAQPLYKQFQQQAMQQQQIAASLQQDDVEAHIKTSIVTVPTASKKPKKSLGKEEKTPPSKPAPASKKEVIVTEDKASEKIEKKLETPQKVAPSVQTSNTKGGQRTPKSIPKPESTFDVLRKSPNFNMALQLKEEAAAAAQLAAAQLGMEYNSKADIFSQATPTTSSTKPVKALLFGSESLTELEKSKLLKPIALPTDVLKGDRTDSEDDLKHSSELENVQKILADPSFDLDPPKIEKPSSIADKVLKALNQIDANEKKTDKKLDGMISNIHQTSKLPLVLKVEDPVNALSILSTASSTIKSEMLKVEPLSFKSESHSTETKPPPALIIPSPNATLKPILASPEHKDIKDSAPKNNDLNETIQKLESVIQKSTTIDRFPEDSSDSTDSEHHRLVIEDESQGSEQPIANQTPPTPPKETKKPAMGVLESIMMEVPYKGNPSPAPSVSTKDKESTDKNQDILTESTNDGSNNETISLLLCEETIPGSPAPAAVKDPLSDSSSKRSSFENPPQNQFIPPQNILSSSSAMKSSNIMTALQHQQQQLTASLSTTTNLKQIPMDIDTEITSSTGNPGIARMKLDRGSTNSSGNNTNNNSDNSPRDSISQSDSEKIENISPKKRKRTRKSSDSEAQHKRRRALLRTANRNHNDSDSEDNSDQNTFTRSTQGSSRPSQYNFLVQLDPGMSGQQRIVVLKKKIQELRKTYNMLKSELASIDRRRKKYRRREREKKNTKVA